MAELSSRALLLLRIHARQAKTFGRFVMHPDNDTLGPLEKELIDAGLTVKVKQERGRIIGHMTAKGQAFCRMASYPNE